MSKSRGATLLATVSILLWCWSGVCFRKGAESMAAMPFLALMTGGGALTVVVLQAARGRPLSALWRLPPRVVVAGFFGVALYTVILAWAFGLAEERDVALVGLLNYLWPMWIVLLSAALLGQRPHLGLTAAGVFLGFGGLALSRGLDSLTRIPSSLLPPALALIGGVLWALYSVLLRRWRVPEEKGGTALHFAVCAAMAACIGLANGQWRVAVETWTPSTLAWGLFGAVGPVGLAYHWWEIGIKRGEVQLIAILAYFTPVGSSILIGAFFREAMNPCLVPGAAMIAVGAWLAHRGAQKGRRADR